MLEKLFPVQCLLASQKTAILSGTSLISKDGVIKLNTYQLWREVSQTWWCCIAGVLSDAVWQESGGRERTIQLRRFGFIFQTHYSPVCSRGRCRYVRSRSLLAAVASAPSVSDMIGWEFTWAGQPRMEYRMRQRVSAGEDSEQVWSGSVTVIPKGKTNNKQLLCSILLSHVVLFNIEQLYCVVSFYIFLLYSLDYSLPWNLKSRYTVHLNYFTFLKWLQ